MKHIEVYNQEYLSIPSVHSFKKKTITFSTRIGKPEGLVAFSFET